MEIARILIDRKEEKDIRTLVEKLQKNGFRLNRIFKDFIVPVSGTEIIKTYDEEHILIIQEKQ